MQNSALEYIFQAQVITVHFRPHQHSAPMNSNKKKQINKINSNLQLNNLNRRSRFYIPIVRTYFCLVLSHSCQVPLVFAANSKTTSSLR